MRGRAAVIGLLSVACALALEGPRAKADFQVETQTFSIPLTQTDYSPGTPAVEAVDPFQVQQFNTNLGNGLVGVLIGVGVGLNYHIQNTITVTFENTATINVQATGAIHLLGPSGTDLVNPASFMNSANLAPLPSDTFAKTVNLPTKDITGLSQAGYNDAATLNAFTGTGQVLLPVIATAESSFTSSSGNGFGGSTTLAGVNLTLQYFFFVVPEPASFVLTALGGVGLLSMAYRSRGRRAKGRAA
jgi:hypothetical protein